MKKLLLLFLLSGCTENRMVLPPEEPIQQAPETLLRVPETKYKAGQCFYLIDHATGKGNPKDILMIDSITPTKYIYRWWIYWTNNWAMETNEGIGEFNLFESMTKEIPCPKQ